MSSHPRPFDMSFLTKMNTFLIRRPSAFAYKYLRQLSFDYRDALIETGKKCWERPLKTLFYSANVSLLVVAYRSMPTFDTYRHALIEFEQQQISTSKLIRNVEVETYVGTIEQLLSSEQLHFVDCYLFSLIIYRRQYGNDHRHYRIYENLCALLNRKRDGRLIDIGAFNRWFVLSRQLRHADVISSTKS